MKFSKTSGLMAWALAAAFAFNCASKAWAQDDSEKVVDFKEIKNGGKLPKAISQPTPKYPSDMSRAGVNGEVVVSYVIDETGRVKDCEVLQSNNPAFERPALMAVKRWKFTPAEKDGRPVAIRAVQTLQFYLDRTDFWEVHKGKDQDKLPEEFQWTQPPIPLATRFPVYPFDQLQRGIGGKVWITYIVGPQGRVVASTVREASVPELGAAVLAMIDAWEFMPAKKQDGTPCYVNLTTEYDFKPKGNGNVPVTWEARDILDELEKNPAAIATLKELDKPLHPIFKRAPEYPSALRRASQPGEAVIEFFVDKNGDAQLPRIVSSSAPEFGYAAVQAVATWRFDEPRRAGKAVVVRAQVPIGFSLSGTEPPAK